MPIKFARSAAIAAALMIPAALAAQALKQIPMPADPIAFMQGEWLSEGSKARIRIEGKAVILTEKSQFGGYWPHLGVGNTIADITGPGDRNVTEFYRPFNAICNRQDGSGATANRYKSECYVVLSQNRSPYKAEIIVQIDGNRFWREKDLTPFMRKHRLRPLSEI